MSGDEREALLEAFSGAWAAGDVDALMGLMADDCEFRASLGPEPGSSYRGREAVRDGFERFLAPSGLADVESAAEPTLISRDFAVTRWTLRGRRPDGSESVVRGCDVFEFDGDRISLKDTYRKVDG
jgi:ketosteroid isomerase-like protein